MKVLHVIIGLHTGGAEMMLLKLLRTLDRDRFDPVVVALMDGGQVADAVRRLGVPVHHLGMSTPLQAPLVLARLRRVARTAAPDLVQGWMYHGNIAATLAARWAPGAPDLVWNIRHGLDDPAREKLLTRWLIRLGARWSHRPRAVVYNATTSIAQHVRAGFSATNAVMIPNGFDLDRFRPDPAAPAALRGRLGVPADTVVVGTLGRRHRLKGYDVLLAAAATVAARRPDIHFALAGRGVTSDDPDLARAIAAAPDLAGRVHLLGEEPRPEGFLAGLDAFCLASRSEGFPNVLGEAMACGVPCVTTDVGEAAVIVAGTGRVVPPADPSALADALVGLLAEASDSRSAACRAAIAERYALDRIAERYARLYAGLEPRLDA